MKNLANIICLLSFTSYAMGMDTVKKAIGLLKCTTQVTTDEDTGDKIYTGRYPFELKRGLVDIVEKIETKEKIKLIIKRHKSNEVIITACICAEIAKSVDRKENDPKYWVLTPWDDNCIMNASDLYRAERNAAMRGGNRLELCLQQPGTYTIRIPCDADINAKSLNGDIDYCFKSEFRTQLCAKAKKVTPWGTSGSSGGDFESWQYALGDQADPITNLISTNGKIKVLD